MSKFVVTNVNGADEILAYADDYVTVSAMMDDTGVVADANGKKIVKKGTFVGGASASVFTDRTQKLKKGTAVIDGVLFNDVDVTYGPAPCALMYAGTVKSSKLPEPVTSEIRGKLAPDCRLSFLAD